MMLLIIAFLPLLLLFLILLYLRSLQLLLVEAGVQNRTMRPSLVWLNLIPVLSLFWQLYTVVQVIRTLRKAFRAYDLKIVNEALLLTLGVVASLVLGLTTFPLFDCGMAVVLSPIWLFFWFVISFQRRSLLRHVENSPDEADDIRPEVRTNVRDWFNHVVPAAEVGRLHRSPSISNSMRSIVFFIILFALLATIADFTSETMRLETYRAEPFVFESSIPLLEEYIADTKMLMFVFVPLLILAWLNASEKKMTILFLRKFRNEKVNRTLQQAILKGGLRQFRLITLDDGAFHPIKANRSTNLLVLTVAFIGLVALATTFNVARSYLAEGQAGWAQAQVLFQEEEVWYILRPILEPAAVLNVLTALLGASGEVGYLANIEMQRGQSLDSWGLLVLAFGNLYLGAAVGLEAVVLVYVLGIIRLNMVAKLKVDDDADVRRTKTLMKRMGDRLHSPTVMAPQATVVVVNHARWQEAVSAFAERADYVLFDISEYTENIAWEIREMLAHHAGKCVFIGNRNMVSQWIGLSLDHPRSLQADVAMLLKGRCFVGYESAETLNVNRLRLACDAALFRTGISDSSSSHKLNPSQAAYRYVAVALRLYFLWMYCIVLWAKGLVSFVRRVRVDKDINILRRGLILGLFSAIGLVFFKNWHWGQLWGQCVGEPQSGSLKLVVYIPHRIFFGRMPSSAPVQLTALEVTDKDSQIFASFSNGEAIKFDRHSSFMNILRERKVGRVTRETILPKILASWTLDAAWRSIHNKRCDDKTYAQLRHNFENFQRQSVLEAVTLIGLYNLLRDVQRCAHIKSVTWNTEASRFEVEGKR